MGSPDPLIGVRAWPATATSWDLARAADEVTLTVAVAARPADAMPAPGAAPALAAAVAASQAARLGEIGSQLMEPALGTELLTPLVVGADGAPAPIPAREGVTPLRRYVTGAALYARAAAALLPPPLDGCATLADAMAAYGVGAAALAAVNGDVRAGALLAPGQPLVAVGGGDGADPPLVPGDEETLTDLAARLGTDAAALLAGNAALALAQPSRLAIPGAVVLPPERVPVPYAIPLGETLEHVAGRFSTDLPALAEANRFVPGLLAPGRTVVIVVAGRSSTAEVGEQDTLDSIWRRLDEDGAEISLVEVAAALANEPAALASAAVLACPAPALPGGEAGAGASAPSGGLTATEAAGAFGADVVAFAQANAALAGVLAEGVTLVAPDGEETELTVARDTLNAVIGRFGARGVTVELPALVAENADAALYRSGARVLLPPPAASLSAPLGAAAGPFAQPVFPLVVTLRLRRDAEALDPERSDSAIPAPSKIGAGLRAFRAFADRLLVALPAVRIATADDADGTTWAADFGPGGIARVALAGGDPGPAPRCLALRPLYRVPQSRADVLVPTLTSAGTLGEETPRRFAGADAEMWARRLLADLDLFRSPSPPPDDELEELRRRLGRAVAGGLAPVLEETDAGDDARAEAAARLEQACDASLAAAYETTLALQYDTTVRSPFPVAPAPGARLHGTVSGGATTIDRATVSLAPGQGFATILLTVADPGSRRTLDPGPLRWVPDTLGLDRPGAARAAGPAEPPPLQLRFAHPLAGQYATSAVEGGLGSPTPPVAQRALAPPPTLVAQEAGATDGGEPPSLGDAGRWTFSVTFAHPLAAQDTLSLRTSFNEPGPVLDPRPPHEGGGDDLAAALFRYAALSGELRERIAPHAVAGAASRTATTVLADPREQLLRTVVELVEPVATAWESHWDGAVAATPRTGDGESYALDVRIERQTAAERLPVAVTLSLADQTRRPSPAGAWPEVAWHGDDGVFASLTPDPSGPGDDGTLRYAAAAPLAPGHAPTLRIAWAGLSVAAVQNGRARLAVRRNEGLVADAATDPAFVTASETVAPPRPAMPALSWHEELPAAAGADLTTAVAATLRELFGDATGPPLALRLEHGEPLGESGPRSWQPVALLPGVPLSPAVATVISDAAAAWLAARGPAPEGSVWGLSLTLSSNVPGIEPQPLLTVDRLVFPQIR